MRALELNTIFNNTRTGEQLEKYKKKDRERLINVRPYVDTRPPISLGQMKDASKSPSKRLFRQQELKAVTAKHNLALAKRIFQIMEGPGLVSTLLDPDNNKHLELHPGTINFNSRLEEAQRIHKENMLLASRLDTMQPYYKRSDFRGKIARSNQNCHKKKKKQRAKFPEIDNEKGDKSKHKRNNNQSTMKSEPVEEHNPFKVLVESTKIQNGKILDVAVIKEPFQDRFVIFGIDVDIGQRYELRLTSEEISSILDGDILVTSLDNIEVWVVLLNKITLNPVEVFSKLPAGVFPKRSLERKLEAKVESGCPPHLEPRPPSNSRPLTSGTSSRVAHRSAGNATSIDIEECSNMEGEIKGMGDEYDHTMLPSGKEKEADPGENAEKTNKTFPFIPALELSTLNSIEDGVLNSKPNDSQQKKASPIGKWDFAPAEETVPTKAAKESKVAAKVANSARSTESKKDKTYNNNTKVSLTARPPAEKKTTTKGRSVAYRKVDDKIHGGPKSNISIVNNNATNNSNDNNTSRETTDGKISSLSRKFVNDIFSAVIKKQVKASSALSSKPKDVTGSNSVRRNNCGKGGAYSAKKRK